MDNDFDFPAAIGEGAMSGSDDEDEEAMKNLYAASAGGAAVAEEEDDADAAYDTAAMKAGEEKGIGKEGLRKKLLKEGEGLERPGAGDEVEGARGFAFPACILGIDFLFRCTVKMDKIGC